MTKSDDLVKSRLGYEYDLKDALKHNPTTIMAGDDICAVALRRIEELEAAVEWQCGRAVACTEAGPKNHVSRNTCRHQILNQRTKPMSDFFDWLTYRAPDWVYAIAAICVSVLLVSMTFLSIVALVAGYWIIPLLIWIVAPAALVVWTYLNEKDKTDDQE